MNNGLKTIDTFVYTDEENNDIFVTIETINGDTIELPNEIFEVLECFLNLETIQHESIEKELATRIANGEEQSLFDLLDYQLSKISSSNGIYYIIRFDSKIIDVGKTSVLEKFNKYCELAVEDEVEKLEDYYNAINGFCIALK